MQNMDRRSNALVAFLTRTPFPSVYSYIAFSFLTFTVSVACVIQTFRTQPELHPILEEEMKNSSLVSEEMSAQLAGIPVLRVLYYVLSNQPLTWVLVNTYFALIALLATCVISYVFKELSRQEEHTVRQTFFTFLLFHIVFLSVVASVSSSHRILPWLFWFGAMAFLNVTHEIVHQRFKFVSPSAGAPGSRLSWLCFLLFATTTFILIGLFKFYYFFETSHLLFLLNDAILAWVRSGHGLVRCLSISDIFGASPDQVRHVVYYVDLCGSVAADAIQLLNHIHLMLFSPFGFNLTCVFFFYQMRLAYQSIATSLSRHAKHKNIFSHIQTTYPQLDEPSSELCIVCWEELKTARKLPCEHAFHDWCLMWWLEQDISCPTCRRPVSAPAPPPARPTQHISAMWRFGGERLGFLRLPTLSIEFSDTVGFLRRHEESQLTSMAEQVREMFPQLSLEDILDDLRVTGSTQSTIENILEGRVGFVGRQLDDDEDSFHDEVLPIGPADAGPVDEELAEASSSFDSSRHSEGSRGTKEFQAKRAEMLAEYRKRYINSDKGADLRTRGILE